MDSLIAPNHFLDGCALSRWHSLRSFQAMFDLCGDGARRCRYSLPFKRITQTLTEGVRVEVSLHFAIVSE